VLRKAGEWQRAIGEHGVGSGVQANGSTLAWTTLARVATPWSCVVLALALGIAGRHEPATHAYTVEPDELRAPAPSAPPAATRLDQMITSSRGHANPAEPGLPAPRFVLAVPDRTRLLDGPPSSAPRVDIALVTLPGARAPPAA
jgi:hypothetical protein